MRRVTVIDSHTGGEPTRLVVSGGPDLGAGSMAERREIFRAQYDDFRSAVVNEPRGSDVIVGALLCQPVDPACAAGVIFFNNVGYLGMCGHGAIGLVVTLQWMGRLAPGTHRIETPAGEISATLHDDGRVTILNVPSFRYRKAVPVAVPGLATVHGDIAWGGNWFFLVDDHRQRIAMDNLEALGDVAWRIRQALEREGITGEDGALIDHIELLTPSESSGARNYVLCPGRAYDRSPCGTGTSAKLACLAADGKLAEGALWRQESVVGSVFEASYRWHEGRILPAITGSAYIAAEATLILDPRDPFAMGIRS